MNTLVIQKIIKRVMQPSEQVMLGRWRITYSEEELRKTIERANEDHCGTCVNPPKEITPTLEKRS